MTEGTKLLTMDWNNRILQLRRRGNFQVSESAIDTDTGLEESGDLGESDSERTKTIEMTDNNRETTDEK